MLPVLHLLWFTLLAFVKVTHSDYYPHDTYDARTEFYSHWMSIMSLFPNDEYYGFNLYDSRLFQLTLPGSHHAGMYETAIRRNLRPSNDAYFSALRHLNNTEKYVAWSIRQRGSVYNQLLAGSRFLDIRLEKYGAEYYAHHGMLGSSLTVMVDDIAKYMALMTGEIVVVKLSEFVGIKQIDLHKIYHAFMYRLAAFIADSKSLRYDITQTDLGTLIKEHRVRIVIFVDKSGVIDDDETAIKSERSEYDHFFYDAHRYLVGDDELRIKPKGNKQKKGNKKKSEEEADIELDAKEQELSLQTIISNTLLQLTKGWDVSKKLNQIFFDVNIEYPSQLSKYLSNSDIYDSFLSVHLEFIQHLKPTMLAFPKVYFANLLIIDYIEYFPMDEILALNANYLRCSDLKWGRSNNDCPKLTTLSKSYKSNEISVTCENNRELFDVCPRSCGLCQWLKGQPGAHCNHSAQCNSPIYTTAEALYGSQATAECHFDANERDKAGICLSPFSQSPCGFVDTISAHEIQQCQSPCTSDYQCQSGYCSLSNGVCLQFDTPSPTSAPTALQCYCDRVTSDSAHQLTEMIEPLRSNQNCESLSTCMNDDYYIQSLVSFGIIPIIVGSVLLGMYLFCCFIFCVWNDWAKYTFCRCWDPCNAKHWWFKWLFAAMLFIVLVIITWQCILGLKANHKMHDDLFDDSSPNTVSFKSEVLGILDTTLTNFQGIGDDIAFITATISIALQEINVIIKRTQFNIDLNVEPIYKVLTAIAEEYDDYSLTATIMDPQTGELEAVTLECGFCRDIGEQIGVINVSLSEAVSKVKQIEFMINEYTHLIAHEVDVTIQLLKFGAATRNFTEYLTWYESGAEYVIYAFEVLDEQREYVGSSIFMAPLLWITLFTLALCVFSLVIWLCRKPMCLYLSEYLFRCTWCCMMFIGSIMMILFGCLAIINIGWADFCVYLDAFESDPVRNTPPSFHQGAKIINACWTGENLFDAFNLTAVADWSSYQTQNMSSFSWAVDIMAVLDIIDLDLFTASVELIDIDEFHTESDLYLSELNQIGAPCTCNCMPWGTEEGTFSKHKFHNGQCFDNTQCWTNPSLFLNPAQLADSATSKMSMFESMMSSQMSNADELSVAGLPNINDLITFGESKLNSFTSSIHDQLPPEINILNAPNLPDLNVEMNVDLDLSEYEQMADAMQQEMQANIQQFADNLQQMDINGIPVSELAMIYQVNAHIAEDYDPSQCVEYVSKAYGFVMAEYMLYNQTVQFVNTLKEKVYNVSASYDSMFVIGIEIDNVLNNISRSIDPLLHEFNAMIDDYGRCGFLGEIYGGFKQVTCVNVFEDMYQITWSLMVIAFLSVLSVLLALCVQYLFHPIRKLVIYRSVYLDQEEEEKEEEDEEWMVCPKCGHHFALSEGIVHVHDNDGPYIDLEPVQQDGKEEEEHDVVVAHWDEYKSMMRMAFYTFAGYLPWSKYTGIYLSVQELDRFLQILCITDPVQRIFDAIDADIQDGRITFNEFMEYFTNQSVNPQCEELRAHIEAQITWQLLVRAMKIFEAMDEDHSGKLEYGEFAKFGGCIGLSEQETEALWNALDTDHSGAIDIVELFEWFRLRLYQQKGRIVTQREPSLQVTQQDLKDLHEFRGAQQMQIPGVAAADAGEEDEDVEEAEDDLLAGIDVDRLHGQLTSSRRDVEFDENENEEDEEEEENVASNGIDKTNLP